MAQAPGGPLRPLPPGASNGTVEKRGLRSYPARPELHGDLPGAGWIKSAAVIEKSPGVGAERQPVGAGNRPGGSQDPRGGPQGPPGCGVGTRAPVAPSPASSAGLMVLVEA